jgi:fructokinase
MSVRIGIDLGGTKIEGIALEGSRELTRLRVATPRDDYAATIESVAAVVSAIEATLGAAGTVGVGIPGAPTADTGLVKNANSVWLIGRPLQADLQARLDRPVRVANDANCFAMSEAVDGAGSGAEVVFGVIVGTGTGAGIAVRGRVLTGPNAIAGEWGHNPLPWPDAGEWPGPECYCGKRGCIETFLSGPGFARDFEAQTGRREAASTIAVLAAAQDPQADAVLRRYESRMARALAGVINVLDPDVIVLGGGMSNIDGLCERVPRLWGEHAFGAAGGERPPELRTRLVRARHGDSSGVRGAAWLWAD